MTRTEDEHPAATDETVPNDGHPLPDPDEESVRRFLSEGPQGPEGRMEMAAAGIDVDRLFPVDDAEDRAAERATDDVEGAVDDTEAATAETVDLTRSGRETDADLEEESAPEPTPRI
jgi:hypothetical protein